MNIATCGCRRCRRCRRCHHRCFRLRLCLFLLLTGLAVFSAVHVIKIGLSVGADANNDNGHDGHDGHDGWPTLMSTSTAKATEMSFKPLNKVADTKHWYNNDYKRISTENDADNGKKSSYAYAFLISGCDPSDPSSYRNYLYNILVATYNLQGTSADVLVMVQLSKFTNHTRLLNIDEQLLTAANHTLANITLHVHYLPKPMRQNFYQAQLEKFRILQFTQYDKIMYLDADVMPLCSLDYLFTSFTTTENLIFAWLQEPAHGGIFVLQTGNFDKIQQIISRREQQALELPPPHWDPIIGWGQRLTPTTAWKALPTVRMQNYTFIGRQPCTNWSFHGDFADQGLLYYWTLYVRKSVSIVFLDTIEEIHHSDNRHHHNIINTTQHPVYNNTCLPSKMEYHGHYGSSMYPMFQTKVPHRDFIHFSGTSKPWEQKLQIKDIPSQLYLVTSSTQYWYYQFQSILQQINNTNININKLPQRSRPSLGRYPTLRSMIKTAEKHQKVLQEPAKQLI